MVNPSVKEAFRAMKSLGISEETVKPVLKKLLKLYDKNWELIEAENFRVLADAIFEAEDTKAEEQKNEENDVTTAEVNEEAGVDAEILRPLKKPKLRYQDKDSSSGSLVPGIGKGKEIDPLPLSVSFPQRPDISNRDRPDANQPIHLSSDNGRTYSHPLHLRDKGKQVLNPEEVPRETTPGSSKTSRAVHVDVKAKGKQVLNPQEVPRETIPGSSKTSRAVHVEVKAPASHFLIEPKDEPVTDDFIPLETHIPIPSLDQASKDYVNENGSDGIQHTPAPGNNGLPDLSSEARVNVVSEKGKGQTSSKVEIASTPCGKVRIDLSYDLDNQNPDFSAPSVQTLLDMVDDRYLKTHEVQDHKYSSMKVMKGMCDCFLELGYKTGNSEKSFVRPDDYEHLAKSVPSDQINKENQDDNSCRTLVVGQSERNTVKIGSMTDINNESGISEKSLVQDALLNTEIDSQEILPAVPLLLPSSRPGDYEPLAKSVPSDQINKENQDDNSCRRLVVRQSERSTVKIGSVTDVFDITKGRERVMISLVNDINNESPPSFHYITRNDVFLHACVTVSLSRIVDKNCCSSCSEDCLSLSKPCVCSQKGSFACTGEGLLKEEFLEECISRVRASEKHSYFCEECPLEKSKCEDAVESCKGHLVQKFIKECWVKCGCSEICGNRVIQRGISRNLQVFMTVEGKGWGLRTLEDLPKGAFVCEYVGEVLTNEEFLHRVEQKQCRGEKQSYPLWLDADWGSGAALKDEKTLCLDATEYGNVARFINHRCFDSNMVAIPVEIETPDHHYYHVAFFTSREVKAMEELTWDYGIDFDDIDHPIKAFPCHCGSKHCRSIKHTRRSRSVRSRNGVPR